MLCWLTLGTQIGISPCHSRLYSWWNVKGVTSLPWLLLYHSVWGTWYPELKGSGRRSWLFPQTPQNILNDWCLSQWLQSTSFPCSCSLSPSHSSIWCFKWALLIYNWIKTHQGHERALALIKSLECTKSNAHYKLLSWQISSCTS